MRRGFISAVMVSIAALVLGTSLVSAASYTTNGGWSWVNSGSTIVIEGFTWHLGAERTTTPTGSGVAVSIETSGIGAGIAPTDQALTARGGTDSMYVDNTVAASIGAQVVTTDAGCTYGQMCANRGQFIIKFSQPMTNPIVHFSGIGGGGYDSGSNGKTTAWTELELLTPGITMTMLSQQNLQLVGNRIELTVKNPTTRCNTITNDYGATASAACGSVRLNGTFTSVAFKADLNSVNNANPYVNGQLEDAFIIAVTIDPSLSSTTTTQATTTTLATTTTQAATTTIVTTTTQAAKTAVGPLENKRTPTDQLPSTGSRTPMITVWATIVLASGLILRRRTAHE